jgi:acyl-coenzyme A synthetase/AMP-(fatty) acid ligase
VWRQQEISRHGQVTVAFTPCCAAGHSYITYGPLLNCATSVIFEGLPTYPEADRYWQVVAKYRVNSFYTGMDGTPPPSPAPKCWQVCTRSPPTAV